MNQSPNPNRRRNITKNMTYPSTKTSSLPRTFINISMMTVAAIIAQSPLRAEVPPEVAKVLLEQKAATPLPKPEGEVVHVKSGAELEQAVRSLKSGQTIMLAAGEYRITHDLVLGAKTSEPLRNIAFRGETGKREDVVIRGPGQENTEGNPRTCFQLNNVDGALVADMSIGDFFHHPIMLHGRFGCRAVRMRNLRLFDAGQQFVKGTSGGPGRIGAKDCIVEHCLIEYTDIGPVANQGYTQGVDIHRGDRNIVRDCIFRNMHVKPGLRFRHGPAVLMWNDSRDSIVERCVFLDCDRGVAFGVNEKPKDGPSDHSGGIIRNNFFYNSRRLTDADVPIMAWNSPGTKILHNTILTNGTHPNAIEYRFANTKGVVIANNLTDAKILARDGAEADVYGNFIKATPAMFVDPAGCDLHLKLLINRVVNAAENLRPPLTLSDCADDFDGQPRRTDVASDIGAAEHRNTPAVKK
jgi:hypothetical protein